jgi:CRISPR/Cas system CSM-associated protein Csm3 (group 7 of RAMP superfamily)
MISLYQYSYRFVCRFTIELTSPLTIGSGEKGLFEDQLVVLDANGLPTIPASSFMGVLRHRWVEIQESNPDLPSASNLFGDLYVSEDFSNGRRSRVELSWGMIHQQNNTPIPPMITIDEIKKDEILSDAYSNLLTRDLVRISHRGTAEDGAKFDRSSVRSGNRFSFELILSGDEKDVKTFYALMALINDEHTLLGAHTRSGLGSYRLIQCLAKSFHMKDSKDFEDLLRYPTSLHLSANHLLEKVNFEDIQKNISLDQQTLSLSLNLKAVEHFLQGGGDLSLYDDKIKIVPYSETQVIWHQSKGGLSNFQTETDDYMITGSSLKGAIRHRTAFHLRKLKGMWAHLNDDCRDVKKAHIDMFDPSFLAGLDDLFGALKNSRQDEEQKGKKGKVSIADVRISRKQISTSTYDHLNIDRFSFAPMQGCLFSDMAIVPNDQSAIQLKLKLYVNTKALAQDENRLADFKLACRALGMAVQDLAEGRLQLGAGAGRGYGYFKAQQKDIRWHGNQEFKTLLESDASMMKKQKLG